MATTVDWIGDPRQVSGEGARHLHVQAGRVVLAGVQLRVRGPRPARQQGAVDDVVRVRVQVLSHRHVLCQRGPQQRRQGRDRTADRGLRHPRGLADLGLNSVSAQIR
jgi:hypothetical protein